MAVWVTAWAICRARVDAACCSASAIISGGWFLIRSLISAGMLSPIWALIRSSTSCVRTSAVTTVMDQR